MRFVRSLAGELRRRVAVEALDENAPVRVTELRCDVLGVQVQVVEHVARAAVPQLAHVRVGSTARGAALSMILIVEDEPLVADFIERGLRARGRETVTSDDAEHALAFALVGNGVQPIVLDLGLPSGDGLAVLRAVRARDACLPVIVLTARQDLRDACLAAGADDYMTKPFRFEELAARIDALTLGRDAQARGAADSDAGSSSAERDNR